MNFSEKIQENQIKLKINERIRISGKGIETQDNQGEGIYAGKVKMSRFSYNRPETRNMCLLNRDPGAGVSSSLV